MRRILAFLGIALLSGCATVGIEKIEQLKPGTSIVPISLMGETLAIRHVGTTVFQNAHRDVTVADWQLDKYTESSASKVVGDGKRFQAIVAETKDARAGAGKLGSDFWTGKVTLQGGTESLTKLAKDAGADYVLVLGPLQLGDPFFGTNQRISGYGVYQRAVFGSRRAINFLTMRIVLLDGKSGAEVARTHGYLSSPRTEVSWMDSNNLDLSADNNQDTRTAIQGLIDAVLRKALAELKLSP